MLISFIRRQKPTGAAAGATLGAWEVGIMGVTDCLRFRALIKAGAKLKIAYNENIVPNLSPRSSYH